MLYLLWALLNTGIFIFFIVTCFNATKLIKERSGVLTAVVFVFGLLSFVTRPGTTDENKEPGSNQVKTWTYYPLDSLDKGSNAVIDIDLENTLISKYSLGIKYGKDKQLQYNIPVSANTFSTGFESGTSWKPISIIVNRTNKNQRFEYEVEGTVTWSLLGMKVYAQPKHWKGVAVLK